MFWHLQNQELGVKKLEEAVTKQNSQNVHNFIEYL